MYLIISNFLLVMHQNLYYTLIFLWEYFSLLIFEDFYLAFTQLFNILEIYSMLAILVKSTFSFPMIFMIWFSDRCCNGLSRYEYANR